MIFAGVDPGSSSYAVAFVDNLGRLIAYREFLTDMVEKDVNIILDYIMSKRPYLISLPSGHGLPFKSSNSLTEKDLFMVSLSRSGKGPLRRFLQNSRKLNGITIPSVIELASVPSFRKENFIDLGTADKVSSAFFYRTMFDSFVLVEAGSKFIAVIVVVNGNIIDGLGGSAFPGSAGFIDGEIAYLMSQFSKLTKASIYSGGNFKRGIEIAKMFAQYYSKEYNIPIIVSGRNKNQVEFGLKFNFRFKEAAVGAAYIASAFSGNAYKDFLEMLNSAGTAIDYVKLEGWEEVTSWIKTEL
ncbi:DUF1464 domain-containing protein [Metallosphaera tengchongensis]|uniref:DUF1464 domain-containing protein n=1 Tax=Metallosphaera tengchongensis TaxID=1532350 RepID=A0A6N0NT32_9CREN|nr:DUF1464 family protein [Metallosphaera tengchongensis]QKR00004.1 DUF1464 domain-containing protein [Metallosphaera tengchongensis]